MDSLSASDREHSKTTLLLLASDQPASLHPTYTTSPHPTYTTSLHPTYTTSLHPTYTPLHTPPTQPPYTPPTQPPYTPPTQPPHTPPTQVSQYHKPKRENCTKRYNDPAEGCTHQCSQCACPSTHRQRAFGFSLLGAARRSRCTKRPLELTWTTSLVVTYCRALMQAPSVPSAQPRETVHITSRESGMKLQWTLSIEDTTGTHATSCPVYRGVPNSEVVLYTALCGWDCRQCPH